jgi:hypothetical protein
VTLAERRRLATHLRSLRAFAAIDPADLVTREEQGGSGHRHVAIGRSGWWLRLPRVPVDHAIAHQAEALRRLAAIGVAPDVAAELPGVGLVVRAIGGRAPRLPDDMAAIGATLARLHAAPVPPARARAPLTADPVADARAIIARALLQAPPPLADWIARRSPPDHDLGPLATLAIDCNPGNFVIDAGGRAWLVDPERVAYGPAVLDLAHATLPTSTWWDPRACGSVDRATVAKLLATRSEATAARMDAARRLVFLRTVAWVVLNGAAAATARPDLSPSVTRLGDVTVLEDWWRSAVEASDDTPVTATAPSTR